MVVDTDVQKYTKNLQNNCALLSSIYIFSPMNNKNLLKLIN